MEENTDLRNAPTLPGCIDGIIGKDPWKLVCRDCGHVSEHEKLRLAIMEKDMQFHRTPWVDDSNPRLCRECRLARGCNCNSCRYERAGTYYPVGDDGYFKG